MGSEILLIQLGFLLYEIGFALDIWKQSIIIKTIEHTFTGIIIYIFISYPFAMSNDVLFGVFGIPTTTIFSNDTDLIFVFNNALYAIMTLTIISGCVLERMKNKAYIVWCILILCICYTFTSAWIWNKNGWLNRIGFTDNSGALVIHCVGGIAGLISVKKLGPRNNSVDKNGKLSRPKKPNNIILQLIGVFIVWFGWFEYIASSQEISMLSHANMCVILGMSCSMITCLIIQRLYIKISLNILDIYNCSIMGLVSITALNKCPLWGICLITMISTPIYYGFCYIVRYKLQIDDPLNKITIHLIGGIYSIIMEGIFSENGLIYGNVSHFGIQILGCITVLIFNLLMQYLLWYFVAKVIFHNTNIRVTILNTYLGTQLYSLDPQCVLEELISCRNSLARQMLLKFHKFCVERYNDEQLDFLVAINVLRDLADINTKDDSLTVKQINLIRSRVVRAIFAISNTYVAGDAPRCINVSDYTRNITLKSVNGIKKNYKSIKSSKFFFDIIDVSIFDQCYKDIFHLMLDPLRDFFKIIRDDKHKKQFIPHDCQLPFYIGNNWRILWDCKPIKIKKPSKLLIVRVFSHENVNNITRNQSKNDDNNELTLGDMPSIKVKDFGKFGISDFAFRDNRTFTSGVSELNIIKDGSTTNIGTIGTPNMFDFVNVHRSDISFDKDNLPNIMSDILDIEQQRKDTISNEQKE